MGNFDDLIPTKAGGNFDDLIPSNRSDLPTIKKASLKPMTWMDKANNAMYEAGSIPRAFVNSATFGALDALDYVGEKSGLPYSKQPKAVTVPGKIAESVAGIAGFTYGPYGVGKSVGSKVLPKIASQSGTFGKLARTAQAATEGGVSSFLAPGDIKERVQNAKFGAIANPTIKAGFEAMKPASVRIAQGIIKPKGRYVKRSGKIAETSLEEGVLRSGVKETQEAAQNKINNLMDQVDALAEKSTGKSSIDSTIRRISATAKSWIKEGETGRAEAIIKKADEILLAKGLRPGKEMTAKELLDFRRNQDAVIKKLYPNAYFRETLPADLETRMELAGATRRELSRISPEIADTNRRIGGLIDVAKSSGTRSGVSARNNLFDIVDYGLAAGGTQNPAVAALLLAKKGWQGGKALAARGMYNLNKTAKRFGYINPTQEAENATVGNFGRIASSERPKLLPAPKTPITTAIPTPRIETGARTLRAPYYVEESPIIFEGSQTFGKLPEPAKVSLLKKMGINPFTGEMKYGKPSTTLQKALERSRQIKK